MTRVLTEDQLIEAGMTALYEALGVVNAVRFLRLLAPGTGDYTAERQALLGNPTLEELLALRDAMRAAGELPVPPEQRTGS